MKIGIVMDNKINKWGVQRFEPLKDELDITLFVGQRNRCETDSIKLKKYYLSHKEEILLGLKEPVTAYKRVFGAPYSKMDFYYFSLQKYLKGMDMVFSCDHMRSAYTLATLKDRLGFKLILTWCENIPYRAVFDPKTLAMQDLVLEKTDFFLPVTNIVKKALMIEGVTEDKIKTIYPAGIDMEDFKPSNPRDKILNKLKLDKNHFIILYVGKLVSWKGVHNLVYAAKILKDKGIEKFTFAIAGSGAQKSNMEKLIQRSGTTSHFKFLDFIPYTEIADIFSIADTAVLTSYPTMTWQEQFGMVLAEAMASGKPVISTLSGSIPEVVGNAGKLIPAGDFFALAETIQELMQNNSLREELGKKGKARAEQLFNAEKNGRRLREVIKRLSTN